MAEGGTKPNSPSPELENFEFENSETDNSEIDLEDILTQESPESDASLKGGSESPSKQAEPDSFFNETKYVVLNFMSLLPQELYCPHLSSTPESAISDLSLGDYSTSHHHPLAAHYKSHNQLSKSKSFDSAPQRRVPKLKHLSHVKSMNQREIESPASEDNLSYRYRQYMQSLDQQSIPSNSPEICLPDCDSSDKGKSLSSVSLRTDSPGSVSPRKTPHSLSRWYSDISSSGDFSYASDADDEGEDLSNASSIFSLRGACLKDGFLDLRKVSPRLSTLTSQSEEELDCVDGLLHHMPPLEEEKSKLDDADDIENGEIEKSEEHTLESGTGNHDKSPSPRQASLHSRQHSKDSGRSHIHSHSHDHMLLYHNHSDPCSHSQDERAEEDVSSGRKSADRSKLTLEIPSRVLQLDDILISLQSDLNSEMTDLESEFEEALRSSSAASGRRHANRSTPLTPQTEAARILARIGDEVRDQYGHQIDEAIKEVMVHQLKELTYRKFKELAKAVIDKNLPGWRQVALLMVFGQKIVWNALQRGQKQFGGLVDLCAQLVADVAAEFIIKEGGWGAVMNFDPSQSSDSQSSAFGDQPSPSILDFFDSHNVTQVESGNLRNDSPEVTTSGTNVDTGQNRRKLESLDNNNLCKELIRQERIADTDDDDDNPGVHLDNGSADVVNCEIHIDRTVDGDICDKNENAQSSELISEKNVLSLSGRDLHPSLGFDYRPGLRTSISDTSSTGIDYSQTDDIKDVFEGNNDIEIVEIQGQPRPTRTDEVDHVDATSKSKAPLSMVTSENNNTNKTESNQIITPSPENVIREVSEAKMVDDTEIDNLNIADNQSSLEERHGDNRIHKALEDDIETSSRPGGSQTVDIVEDSETGDAVTDDGSSSVSSVRMLGFGVGLSLGVLVLAIGMRHIGVLK